MKCIFNVTGTKQQISFTQVEIDQFFEFPVETKTKGVIVFEDTPTCAMLCTKSLANIHSRSTVPDAN